MSHEAKRRGYGARDAVEIYPADADVGNVANMRHLWLVAGEPSSGGRVMSECDINRWQDTITPRDKAPQPWTIGSGGSWDMTEVQPIPDAMLAELAQRYQYAGTPWNCRSMPLRDSDREYMYLLYYSMQGLVARTRQADSRAEDLAVLVRRLVRALTKAAPDNDLTDKALDYLKRAGLDGSPLRG